MGDDRHVPQNQLPSNITCNVTQTVAIQTAVATARLVFNPIGYDINVPNSHFVTQVQPRPEPEDHYQEDKMNMTLLKDRESYVHEPKHKTDFRDILVPDDEDQQNPVQHPPTGWGA
jgi:hypothetical protein